MGHRRKNFGEGFIGICHVIRELALRYPGVGFIYPVHLNSNVQMLVYNLLNDQNNVYLIKPLMYEAFTYLMNRCYLILTGSGGIQEEAPNLGKPVLVTRGNTKHPEALETGAVRLVGTGTQNIIVETSRLLDDVLKYKQKKKATNPYGDGSATEKIIKGFLDVMA